MKSIIDRMQEIFLITPGVDTADRASKFQWRLSPIAFKEYAELVRLKSPEDIVYGCRVINDAGLMERQVALVRIFDLDALDKLEETTPDYAEA